MQVKHLNARRDYPGRLGTPNDTQSPNFVSSHPSHPIKTRTPVWERHQNTQTGIHPHPHPTKNFGGEGEDTPNNTPPPNPNSHPHPNQPMTVYIRHPLLAVWCVPPPPAPGLGARPTPAHTTDRRSARWLPTRAHSAAGRPPPSISRHTQDTSHTETRSKPRISRLGVPHPVAHPSRQRLATPTGEQAWAARNPRAAHAPRPHA